MENQIKTDNKKIDPAWFSLIFSVPGLLMAVVLLFSFLGYKTAALNIFSLFTYLTYGEPATAFKEVAAIALVFIVLGVVGLHFILLIPAWLVARKTENQSLKRGVKIYFFLLTILLVALYLFN